MATPKPPTLLDLFGPNPLAASKGPTAYDSAMRANLGLDVQKGGVQPTSGMAGVGAQAGTPSWYTPVAATPDPLMQLLSTSPQPTAPSTPRPTNPILDAIDTFKKMLQREYEQRRDRH